MKRPSVEAFVAIGLPLYLLLVVYVRPAHPLSFCLWSLLLRFPCPGCGITRSVLALVRGDVAAALAVNAAGVAVAIFYLVQVAVCIGKYVRPKDRSDLTRVVLVSDRFLLVALLSRWTLQVLLPRFLFA